MSINFPTFQPQRCGTPSDYGMFFSWEKCVPKCQSAPVLSVSKNTLEAALFFSK